MVISADLSPNNLKEVMDAARQNPAKWTAGYPKFVTESWYGIWAPKGTAEERVQLLNKAANEAVRQLSSSGAFEQLGIEPVTESTDDFRKYTLQYITK